MSQVSFFYYLALSYEWMSASGHLIKYVRWYITFGINMNYLLLSRVERGVAPPSLTFIVVPQTRYRHILHWCVLMPSVMLHGCEMQWSIPHMLATIPNNTTNTFVAISEGGERLGGGTSDISIFQSCWLMPMAPGTGSVEKQSLSFFPFLIL